jgi:hypothetical protein
VESGTQWRQSVPKCSGRGGEDTGARMSALEMAGSVAPFCRVGEVGRRSDKVGGRW